MRIMSKMDPVGGMRDFWTEFTRPNPYRWPILIASALMTLGLLYGIISQKDYADPPRPEVTYITSYAPDRTDAEIAASNALNQQRQEQLQELREASEERRKEIYRSLGRATGLDVDRMEAEARAEEAREQAEAKRVQDELMGRSIEPAAE